MKFLNSNTGYQPPQTIRISLNLFEWWVTFYFRKVFCFKNKNRYLKKWLGLLIFFLGNTFFKLIRVCGLLKILKLNKLTWKNRLILERWPSWDEKVMIDMQLFISDDQLLQYKFKDLSKKSMIYYHI